MFHKSMRDLFSVKLVHIVGVTVFNMCSILSSNFYKFTKKFIKNNFSSYKMVWQIPKLNIIAYKKKSYYSKLIALKEIIKVRHTVLYGLRQGYMFYPIKHKKLPCS